MKSGKEKYLERIRRLDKRRGYIPYPKSDRFLKPSKPPKIRCEKCSSEDSVECHHLSYSPEKIIAVCRKCHASIHKEKRRMMKQLDWVEKRDPNWEVSIFVHAHTFKTHELFVSDYDYYAHEWYLKFYFGWVGKDFPRNSRFHRQLKIGLWMNDIEPYSKNLGKYFEKLVSPKEAM